MNNHHSPFMKVTLIKISYVLGVPILTFLIFNLIGAPLVVGWSFIAAILMAGAALYPPIWYSSSLAFGGGMAILFSGMNAFIVLIIWTVIVSAVGHFLYRTLIPEIEAFGG